MNLPKVRIVVVDDEAMMRLMLRDFFESQGYQVISFTSALEVIELLSSGAKIDVLISDIRMSPLSGIDLLRILKQHGYTVPIFLFTAAGSLAEKVYALRMGAVHYFSKPFSLTDLKVKVEEVIGESLFH